MEKVVLVRNLPKRTGIHFKLSQFRKLRPPRPLYAPAQPALQPAPLAQELALNFDQADVFMKTIV